MSLPRVLIVYNEPVLPVGHPDAYSEHDIVDTAEKIEAVFQQDGFPVDKIGFNYNPRPLLDAIQEKRPDVVFNLFEGIATQTGTEISVAALLEWQNIPFTGSPSFAIALGRDKVRTKHLLRGASLPTAPFLMFERFPCPKWEYEWPAIVKPACQDSSVGIEQGSVVTNQEELESRVRHVLDRYGAPILIEQFIFGREFHVNFIEESGDSPLEPKLTMVPLAEIRFDYQPGQNFWPIYSYDAKWDTDSEEYKGTPLDSHVTLEPKLLKNIERMGGEAFRLAGLRDYGRLDLRLTPEGVPYILEVNPNPYLMSIALIDGLEKMGRKHSRFIVDMVWNCLARAGKQPSAFSDYGSVGPIGLQTADH